jgi:hypothetical protein
MGEIAKLNITFDMYGQKREDGRVKTLSEVLEEMDPSEDGSTLDAFERQLKARGIYTRDIPELGLKASAIDTFFLTNDNKVLFPEFVNRTIRIAFSRNNILNALVGASHTVDSDLIKTPYMDRPDRKKTKKRRITEATELPKSKIGLREQMVRFYKYGRAIEGSYEAIRRMTIPMFQRLVEFIVGDAALDKAEEAIATLILGDGNNNAAPVDNLSTLDSAAAGKITGKAWINWLMKFDVFAADTMVATKDAFVDIVLMQEPNLTAAQVLSLMVKGDLKSIPVNTPQFPDSPSTLLWHDDIPDANFTGKKILAFNKAAGIEEYVEAGSIINEAQKYITNQTQVMTMTENSGYSKVFKEAARVLDLGA